MSALAVIKRLRTLTILFAFATAAHAASNCPGPRDLQPGATLETVAANYLGSSEYAIAIALATNERTAEGFRYIANPDDLTGIVRVCVPSKAEARQLKRSWTSYDRAVSLARLPRSSVMDANLLTIPADQPVNLVAWVRTDQADRLKLASGAWVATAPSDTWVTIEPHLQSFCRAFQHGGKDDEAKLTQRLEQHLGLSPASSKTHFVQITLSQPGPATIFRPCVDPASDRANCPLGPPAKASTEHRQWLYQQYYSSYGQSLIGEFPWTALGYTFDWAPGKSSQFQRYGESEFVIRKDAAIEIRQVLTTAQYCAK